MCTCCDSFLWDSSYLPHWLVFILGKCSPLWTIGYIGTCFMCAFPKSLLLDFKMCCECLRGRCIMLALPKPIDPEQFFRANDISSPSTEQTVSLLCHIVSHLNFSRSNVAIVTHHLYFVSFSNNC
jgi:hypothetical protein